MLVGEFNLDFINIYFYHCSYHNSYFIYATRNNTISSSLFIAFSYLSVNKEKLNTRSGESYLNLI